MRKWLIGLLAVLAVVSISFLVSPWPSILLVRAVFDRGAAEASRKLEPYLPSSVVTATHRYDPADPSAALDIHRAVEGAKGPTVVWVHGGGFVSGRRSDITNYAKVLAGHGFTVVNVDYTIAPEAHYPERVRQVNQALAYLSRESEKLGVNSAHMVLAGDSAGAQIAAQSAAIITNPAYAKLVGIQPGIRPEQLAGTLLYCGVYDISGMGHGGGILGWFVQSAGWAYSGKRDWRDDAQFRTMSVAPHLNSAFPPAFVSAGNADPLGPQSVAMAQALKQAGVAVETLFYPSDYTPPLGHEYQFDLTSEAGRMALKKSVTWLRQLPR
ncbi:alpha/beta hydrolase [Sphingomonas edaphi]|uniref:Alpha/beta hydrolase n=1 Tax=Sphingomonas edaphi TaxID=2315689 RepID=A0A418PZH3_9SPHN|nr:alpha/beta hydrolase [Sphingomonas edaphi]